MNQPKTKDQPMPSPSDVADKIRSFSLIGSIEGDKLMSRDGAIATYKHARDPNLTWAHAAIFDLVPWAFELFKHEGTICLSGNSNPRDIIRNLSQEERERKVKPTQDQAKDFHFNRKHPLDDPWDGVIRLPEKRCQCCGQVVP